METDLSAKAEAKKNEGNVEFKKGNYRDAIQHYSEAIDIEPSAPILSNRAASYIALKEYTKAIDDAKRAIHMDEKFAKAQKRLYKCYLALGDVKYARIHLTKATELEPNDASNKADANIMETVEHQESMIEKGIAEKDYEKVVSYTASILKNCVQSLKHITLRIEYLLLSHQLKQAVDYTQELIQRPEYSQNAYIIAWHGRAMLYSGNETMAKKSLMQALQYDPDYQPAKAAIKAIKKVAEQKELASDIFKKGDYEHAAIAFQKCAEIDDLNLAYNATALLNKAICETKLNKTDEAFRSLNQAIKMNPNYAKALVKRGEVNMMLKEYEEAVRDFNKASQLDSTGFGVQQKLKEAQKMAKAAKKKDYYGLLGIPKDADDNAIKKAFRKAARDWHPDKFSSKPQEEQVKAEKMFKELNEANAVLSDPKKRQAYDQGADNLEDIERGGGMGGFGGGGMDPNDIFQMFMGGGMGGQGRGRGGARADPFGDMGGFNFGNMGGGRGGNQQFTFRFQ